MSEKKKSAQAILNEKLANGTITMDYFIRRTRELARERVENEYKQSADAREKVKENLDNLHKELDKKNSDNADLKKQVSSLQKELDSIKAMLNEKSTEKTEEHKTETKFTSFEQLKKYLKKFTYVKDVKDASGNTLFTSVLVLKNTTDEKIVAEAVASASVGPKYQIDDNNNIFKSYVISDVSSNSTAFNDIIDSLAEKMYSCEIQSNEFGAVPFFIKLGNAVKCSLYTDTLDWFFEEQKAYLKVQADLQNEESEDVSEDDDVDTDTDEAIEALAKLFVEMFL